MVSLPLHGEIYALNGDNIVAFQKCYVLINIYMGVMYTCISIIYICIAERLYVLLSAEPTLIVINRIYILC